MIKRNGWGGVVYIIETECYYHIFWATEYWTLGLFPPWRRAVFGMIYTKRKKGEERGGGSSPFFGVNWGAVSRLSWPLFCSGIEIPLSWGISMKQKQRDRFAKIFSFLSTHFKPIPGFRERDLTCCLQRKIEFQCGIGLNKIRRSGLESGLDVAFWGGTQ